MSIIDSNKEKKREALHLINNIKYSTIQLLGRGNTAEFDDDIRKILDKINELSSDVSNIKI